ncbi:MAG: VTT domain-containing protein [Candidatus Aenigmarchaeota archaeon]|nr:VTT domain-containing protein [Candidatus Aenigmarchaeota archaeon]
MLLDLINVVLHINVYLAVIIQDYGLWVYLILFLILFLETGLVITPFLPGDSLIFVAAAFAATGTMNILWLFVVFAAGAILGDTVNYWIGHHIGKKIFHQKNRFVNQDHLKRAEAFYEKHGNKTIILARFLPIIRTFAPFVAGIAHMNYERFLFYNITGGIGWVLLFLGGGYLFGNIPFVQENFWLVVGTIIVITIVYAVYAFLKLEKE